MHSAVNFIARRMGEIICNNPHIFYWTFANRNNVSNITLCLPHTYRQQRCSRMSQLQRWGSDSRSFSHTKDFSLIWPCSFDSQSSPSSCEHTDTVCFPSLPPKSGTSLSSLTLSCTMTIRPPCSAILLLREVSAGVMTTWRTKYLKPPPHLYLPAIPAGFLLRNASKKCKPRLPIPQPPRKEVGVALPGISHGNSFLCRAGGIGWDVSAGNCSWCGFSDLSSHPIRHLLFPSGSFPCHLSHALGGRWSSWMVHQNSPHQWVQGGKREEGLGHVVGLGLSIPLAHQLERLQLNELTINAPASRISTSPFSPLILL